MKTSKLTPIILIVTFFSLFLLLTPLGIFNDWIPPTIHTGFYSIDNIDPGDDHGYYVYLRSLFFDGNIDFYNELNYGHAENFNSTGYSFNNWQVGQSILVLPFFLLGHLCAHFLNALGHPVSINGYSFPYYMSTALASQTYLFIGLLITFQINRKYFTEIASLLATLMIWVASPLIYFTFIRQRMAHTIEFFLSALFIWIWLNNRESSNRWKHALMGGLLGFLGSVRVMGIGLAIIYFVDQLWLVKKSNFNKLPINCLICFAVSVLIFISTQLFTWQTIEGFPLPIYNVEANEAFASKFSVFGYLENAIFFFLGHKWGILYSSPVLLLGAIGVIFCKKLEGIRFPIILAILAYTFLIIYYAKYLASYQFRYLIPIYPLVSLGLGYVFSEAFKFKIPKLAIILLSIAFVISQYFVLIQYKITVSYQDPQFIFKALSNIPTIISERSELLLRSTNIFRLFSLDVDFNWTYKEFSYFIFYPMFQALLVILGCKAFCKTKKYFETSNGEKSKAIFIFGVLIIFILDIFLIISGPEKSEAEIRARLDYKKFNKQAKKAEERGDINEAILSLEKAVEAFPSSWRANSKLGLFLTSKGDIEKANKYYQASLRLNSQQPIGKYNLAKNFVQLGELDRAEGFFRSSIQDNPINPKPYQDLAQLLFKQKKVEEAERFFNKAIELNPKFGLAYSNLAILLNRLNRHEEAEKFFKKAIALNPKLGNAHLNLAILLTNLKRYNEAISHIKKAFDAGIISPIMGRLIKFYGIQIYEIGEMEKKS
jgi:tetratricopeptide (TPR) repeat protein